MPLLTGSDGKVFWQDEDVDDRLWQEVDVEEKSSPPDMDQDVAATTDQAIMLAASAKAGAVAASGSLPIGAHGKYTSVVKTLASLADAAEPILGQTGIPKAKDSRAGAGGGDFVLRDSQGSLPKATPLIAAHNLEKPPPTRTPIRRGARG